MSHISPTDPAVAAVCKTLASDHTTVEAFSMRIDQTRIVRLVLSNDEIKVVVDVEAMCAPDGSSYHLDPYLEPESYQELRHLNIFSADELTAMEQGSKLAIELATAHAELIKRTARNALVTA